MIQANLQDIASFTGGSLASSEYSSLMIEGVSTDTRTICYGNLFVPLAGERYNGHHYIAEALETGAAAFLWEAGQGEPPKGPAVIVDDTLSALQRLAAGYRDTLPVRIVGITGSNGKTTTKDMTAAVLGMQYLVHKTQGNLNNHIGLPLTLLALSPETQFAVLEMGMSGRGEIELLSSLARPDVAVITNIGDAHLLQLGTKDEIARAKLEIVSGLAEGSSLIVPGDEPLMDRYLPETGLPNKCRVVRFGVGDHCDVRLASAEIAAEETRFLTADTAIPFVIPMPGKHNAVNALAAIAVGRAFGLDDELIARELGRFKPSGMRIERVEGQNGSVLWNDAYNANPTSMRAALALLAEAPGFQRKFAVLGDMLELGPKEEQFHREIGRSISPESVDFVFTFGELGREIAEGASPQFAAGHVEAFDSKEALAARLERMAAPGDLILVKASRGIRMETIIQAMKAEP